MDSCFAVRSVTLSTRDPPWISPLLKYLLKKRSKAAASGRASKVKELTDRVSVLIAENRKNWGKAGLRGSQHWWRKVDNVSLRKHKPQLVLHAEFIEGLNDFFINLCQNSEYVESSPVAIETDTVTTPVLDKYQVMLALSKIKRTAAGPDGIPYSIWKDNAHLLAPAVTAIWNLSSQKHPFLVLGNKPT